MIQDDGNLGPVTWSDPSTQSMLAMLAAAYAAPILVPLAVALVVVVARCG